MERVTSAFCGGGGGGGTHGGTGTNQPSLQVQVQVQQQATATAVVATGSLPAPVPRRSRIRHPPPAWLTWEQLMVDERWLTRMFRCVTVSERRWLCLVCTRWRDLLYRARWWAGMRGVVHCREARSLSPARRRALYTSLQRRGFRSLALVGAADEDALELPVALPHASAHVHSLALRCCSLSDRGLETIMDHLQVILMLKRSSFSLTAQRRLIFLYCMLF